MKTIDDELHRNNIFANNKFESCAFYEKCEECDYHDEDDYSYTNKDGETE